MYKRREKVGNISDSSLDIEIVHYILCLFGFGLDKQLNFKNSQSVKSNKRNQEDKR